MRGGKDRFGILIACALAVFWPGSFVFGFPGILRQHWHQVFEAGAGDVGGTVFFILAGATCFMYVCGLWQEKYGPGRLAAMGFYGSWPYGRGSPEKRRFLVPLADLGPGRRSRCQYYVLVFSLLGTLYLLASGLILLVRPWRECRI